MNVGFLSAATVSLFTWGIHTFLGGPAVAKPLLDSDMEEVAKYTNYDCWHAITIVLFAMAGGYAYAAFVPAGWDVAALFTFLAGAFAVWSWVLIFWSKRTALELPQWTLFLAISIAAGWGLLT